jgi:hypothetical protein
MGSTGHRPAKWLRFVAGMVCGAGFCIGGLLAMAIMFNDVTAGGMKLIVSGVDVSAHRGAKVAIRRQSGSIELTCNGRCDDFRVDNVGRGNGVREAQVFDASGRRIARGSDPGIIWSGTTVAWRVAGRDRLAVTKVMEPAASQ